MILFKKRKQAANSRKRLSYQIFWTKMTEREREIISFSFHSFNYVVIVNLDWKKKKNIYMIILIGDH